MEHVWSIKNVLESPKEVHIKVEFQPCSEFRNLTLSPIRSPGPHWIQIDAQDVYEI
jgi:hypothetical protein